MKNLIFFFATVLFITTNSFAQKDYDSSFSNGFRKSISVEFSGSHIHRGINYEMRLNRGRKDGLGFKVGVGGRTFRLRNILRDNNYIVTIPLELNYITGKRKHALVTGLGVLTTFANDNYNDLVFGGKRLKSNGFDSVGAYAVVGYRWQPKNKGLTWGFHANPFYVVDQGVEMKLGVNVGFSF